jgi:hypothetical protein
MSENSNKLVFNFGCLVVILAISIYSIIIVHYLFNSNPASESKTYNNKNLNISTIDTVELYGKSQEKREKEYTQIFLDSVRVDSVRKNNSRVNAQKSEKLSSEIQYCSVVIKRESTG